MITREILQLINHKLQGVIIYLVIIGLAFFILAAAILFFPEVLQYLFILGFFLISFLAFLMAIKINHIKISFDKLLVVFAKKNKTRK